VFTQPAQQIGARDFAHAGLSRNTVARWLHGEVDGPPKYRRGELLNKLTVFHEALKQALNLEADARRPKHERRTAKALHVEIKAAGYDGGYTRVTDFIRAWRQGEGQAVSVNAFVPLAFALRQLHRAQRLAGPALPIVVGGGPPSRARSVLHAREGTVASSPSRGGDEVCKSSVTSRRVPHAGGRRRRRPVVEHESQWLLGELAERAQAER